EGRVTPAIRTWTGAGANDLWTNAANWATGVPAAGDDVCIPDVGPASAEVLFDTTATAVSINSLTSDGANPVGEPFRITGSTLTLNGPGTFSLGAGLTLGGGTLTGNGSLAVLGLLTWTGGVMRGSGRTDANGGMLVNGPSGVALQLLDTRVVNNAG